MTVKEAREIAKEKGLDLWIEYEGFNYCQDVTGFWYVPSEFGWEEEEDFFDDFEVTAMNEYDDGIDVSVDE